MKSFVLYRVLKQTHALPFITTFLITYCIASAVLWIVDPKITSYADGLWLGFNIVTSIGLGDFTVTRLVARLAAVVLGLYGALIVAFIPSLVASYYLEKVKGIRESTFNHYKEELQHISSMTPEQKQKLALQIHERNHIFNSKKMWERRESGIASPLRTFELFGLILKQTKLVHFLSGFLIGFVICGFLIYLFDPSITSLYDAYWFSFTIITTIGFGDFTVVHWTSRFVTVFLGIYGIFIIGFTCGVIASYFLEVIHYGGRESVSQMLWKFEHLDLLTPEELRELEIDLHHAGIKRF